MKVSVSTATITRPSSPAMSPRARLKDGDHVVLLFLGSVVEIIISTTRSGTRDDGRYWASPAMSPRAQLKDGDHVVLAFLGSVMEIIVSTERSGTRDDGRFWAKPIVFAANEEGIAWARGWRTPAARALRAFVGLTT